MSLKQKLIDLGFTEEDLEEIKEFVIVNMGEPLISLELDEEHIYAATYKAKMWFDRKVAVVRPFYATPYITDTSLIVQLPRYAEGVSAVYTTMGTFTDFFAMFLPVFFLLAYVGIGWISPLTVSYFNQVMQHISDTIKTLGGRNVWYYDKHRKEVIIRKSHANMPGTFVRVDIISNYWTLKEVDRRLLWFFYEKIMVEIMWILSRIRGKFSSVPGAQESLTLDAERLYTMANERDSLLEEKISKEVGVYPIIFG